MSFSGHIARKRFGQHWLKDTRVLESIVETADINSADRILEVGPGRGALTERLLALKPSLLHAIELDRDLSDGLRGRFKLDLSFSLKEGDVLSVPLDLPDGKPANKVVANIPYNITGPLLARLVGRLGKPMEHTYERLVLLLQKEVAERILASPGDSIFSALSVRLQLLAKCKGICDVSPKCFQPRPKVHSKVILIEPFKVDERFESSLGKSVELLLKTAFLSRRKMLRNSLQSIFPLEELECLAGEAGIRLESRPQELSPDNWLSLARKWNLRVNLLSQI